MVEKITALVLAVFAFIAELFLCISGASAEAIAAVILLAAAVIAIVFIVIDDRRNTVTLTEDAPKGFRGVDKALKLSNELAPYIKTKNGKISITVKKK